MFAVQLVHDALLKAGLLSGVLDTQSLLRVEAPIRHNNGTNNNNNSTTHTHFNGHQQHQQQPQTSIPVGSGAEWSPADVECPAWTACWSAICGVWASKWNHRAWLSRRSAGLPEEQLAVSVLIQQVWGCRHMCSSPLPSLVSRDVIPHIET